MNGIKLTPKSAASKIVAESIILKAYARIIEINIEEKQTQILEKRRQRSKRDGMLDILNMLTIIGFKSEKKKRQGVHQSMRKF